MRSSLPSRLRQLLSSEGSIGPSVKLDYDPVSLLFLYTRTFFVYFLCIFLSRSTVIIIGKCVFQKLFVQSLVDCVSILLFCKEAVLTW